MTGRRMEDRLRDRIHGLAVYDVVGLAMKDAAIFAQHSVTLADVNREGWQFSVRRTAASEQPNISSIH